MSSKFKLYDGLSWIWISDIFEKLLNKVTNIFLQYYDM